MEYFRFKKWLVSLPEILCASGSRKSLKTKCLCSKVTTFVQERGVEVVCGDCLNVQFRSCMFDVVISIAVLHHMTTEQRRINALREIGRILRPGGRAMVTSWAMEQSVDGKSSNYVQQGGVEDVRSTSRDATNSKNSPHSQHLPIHKPRTQFESQGKQMKNAQLI